MVFAISICNTMPEEKLVRKPSPTWLVLCIDSGAVAARCSDVWMLGGLGVVACAEPTLQVHSWLEKKRECCRSLRHLLQVLCIHVKTSGNQDRYWKPDMTSENQSKMRNDPIVPLDDAASAHQKIQFRPGGMREAFK